ncbi:MAG: hypothetical protein QOF01_4717 [Thermomicrobiales bacterium]|nr:hypothetical protein [Thermomicrobiales bacterium]
MLPRCRFHRGNHPPKFLGIVWSDSGAGPASRVAFEEITGVADTFEILQGQLSDEIAGSWFPDDQAFVRELRKCFPDGSSTDAEPFGNFCFTYAISRSQLTSMYPRDNCRVNIDSAGYDRERVVVCEQGSDATTRVPSQMLG